MTAGKWWSLLFGVTMLACLGLCLIAPLVGWWMPPGVSTHAGAVDGLFYIILGITTFFFILTEALLIVFMWRYGARPQGQPAPAAPPWAAKLIQPLAKIFHDQHRIELGWTIVPAIILLFIAVAQIKTWADVKYRSHMPGIGAEATPVVLEVSARQFEWRIRYPSPQRLEEWFAKKGKKDFDTFHRNPHQDDLHVVNQIHAIVNRPVLLYLHTKDVIHSFNLPHQRVKQDALPGKTLPVWFTPTQENATGMALIKQKEEELLKETDAKKKQTLKNALHDLEKKHVYDLACAELCGWGHYRMVGRLTVHKDEQGFLSWLRQAHDEEHRRPTKVIAAR